MHIFIITIMQPIIQKTFGRTQLYGSVRLLIQLPVYWVVSLAISG